MPINIFGTEANNCDSVLDAPASADVNIHNTNANNVKIVYKIREDKNKIREKILESLESGTPYPVVERFINSLEGIDINNTEAIAKEVYSSGLDKFLKSKTLGVLGFVSSIVGIISPFIQ
ncbi:hypothetical protein Q5X42_17095 [Acinetobacter baumannii]|nr:hypothetical protein [Acinetobacter baumannii]